MFQRRGLGEIQLFGTYIALNELNEISPCIKKIGNLILPESTFSPKQKALDYYCYRRLDLLICTNTANDFVIWRH